MIYFHHKVEKCDVAIGLRYIMPKVITGNDSNTSFGRKLIYNEQQEYLSVGETILYKGNEYVIKRIDPPSKPGAKWAVEI